METLRAILADIWSAPEKTLGYAATLAILSGIGWLISRFFGERDSRRRQQLIWQADFTAKQLEELYGPLAFLVTEGEQTFVDLLGRLGRNYVFDDDKLLPRSDLSTWLFWVEQDFLPRNRQIRALLATKAHLIEGAILPKSFVQFLKHQSSWELAHCRWKKENVEYSWHLEINWPDSFPRDVLETFKILKDRHSRLVGKLSGS